VTFIFIVVGLFAFINILGVKSGTRMVIVLTALKLTPLVLLIVIGIFGVKSENLAITSLPDVSTFGTACLLLFFAFGGSETALNISGEIKNPGKTIPRGILMGITGILVIYLLLQFVATGVLGADLALYTEAPLAETAVRLIGPIGGTILIMTAVVSMYSLVGGDILATSRLPFAASEDGLLPKVVSRVHPKFKSPFIAIIIYSGIIFVMAISGGGFVGLATSSSIALLTIYLGVVLAMFKGRFRPDVSNPTMFRVPGGLTVPILALVVLVWVLSYVALNEFIGLGIFFLFTMIFYFGYGWRKRSK
jgi:amino acid transporter